jgi:hypothetical protein
MSVKYREQYTVCKQMEDTQGMTRNLKSKRNIQHNGQKIDSLIDA